MKIVIEQQGIKRELEGPFSLCLSREDLKILQQSLERGSENFSYGWIKIYEEPEIETRCSTNPLKWTDPLNVNTSCYGNMKP